MPRIGIIAWLQESNTFLPRQTTRGDFANDVLLVSEAIRERFAEAPHEIGGFFAGLAAAGFEAVPIFASRAYPFGTILAADFSQMLAELLAALRAAGPLDGLLVAPHGATVSEDFPDADGLWLAEVRKAVGPQIPVIGTLDPHANLSPAMVAATTALIAYRTNPHVDQFERGCEAAELIVRTVRGEVRPVQAASYPPAMINIERQCTDESPLRELVARFDHVRSQPGVLSSSLLLGFPYADVGEMGSAAVVVADGNQLLATEQSQYLGQQIWQARHALTGEFISVEAAIAQISQVKQPVCLLDMGDNVGGGSPGDGTILAWELHRQQIGPAFVCLYDPGAVFAAKLAGTGHRIKLEMGGKTDQAHGPPLVAEVTVRQIANGVFQETEARHGGYTHFDQGKTAIVETDHHLTIMLTSRRIVPFSLKQLTKFGLQPTAYVALVAKGVNAPLAAYRPICPTILRVDTPGVTTADVRRLPYFHRRKPMFPFEPEAEWQGG